MINQTQGRVVAERAELATSFISRLRGLIGRRGWEGLDGLWIEPCAGVHGLGMRFAIDVVLLDEALGVIWVGTLRPWRMGRIHLDARAALELPAGTADRTGTAIGDVLALER